MATRRVIRAVLGNFLGTYTSRYSEFRGYWLFGFLVRDLQEQRIDLLGPTVGESGTATDVAVGLGTVRFRDQLRKSGLTPEQVRTACLVVRRLPGPVAGSVNGHPSDGWEIQFTAEAAMDDGRRFEKTKVVFVSPHDTSVELRSVRVP